MITKQDLEQVKTDMLDYYEGDVMQIDVNTVADLVNEVERLRANSGMLRKFFRKLFSRVPTENPRLTAWREYQASKGR